MKPERRTRKDKIDDHPARAGRLLGRGRLIEAFRAWGASKVGEPTRGVEASTRSLPWSGSSRFATRERKLRFKNPKDY
jgi:hypothetical protein